jgi:hypothetical protein
MIGFRPRDFEFGQQMLNITRSTVYVIARYHPSGRAGWLTKPHPKNGDWRRFTISKQMCQAVQEHIEEYSLGPDDLLFPQWMFAYTPSSPSLVEDDEDLPAGRRAIEDAAPDHVRNVRRHFIDLLTPAELDMLAALNERVLRHLAEEPFSGQCTSDG